jgi:ATP-dependent DNA ligase
VPSRLTSRMLSIVLSRSKDLMHIIPPASSLDLFSIILDGEMLVWDPSIEKYCSFGNLKTAALGMFQDMPIAAAHGVAL